MDMDGFGYGIVMHRDIRHCGSKFHNGRRCVVDVQEYVIKI